MKKTPPFVLAASTPAALAVAIATETAIICTPDTANSATFPPGMSSDVQVAVNLRSDFVYSEPLAPAIAEGLGKRFNLTFETVENLSTALSEALSNGLLHGNLEVQVGENHLSPDVWTLSNERVNDPHYAHRLIWLSATLKDDVVIVEMHNEGPGFNGPAPSPDRGAHRGLALMQAATLNMIYSDGMRCLKMTFSV